MALIRIENLTAIYIIYSFARERELALYFINSRNRNFAFLASLSPAASNFNSFKIYIFDILILIRSRAYSLRCVLHLFQSSRISRARLLAFELINRSEN